jgi:circadian clock protein KaiB
MPELKDHSRNKFPPQPGSAGNSKYILKLFVSGILQNSVRAIRNINRICELHLKGNYKLEIIDIYQQPDLAISEQIIVIPVMIIKFPLPERRIIGDLSDTEKVLETLNCNQ